MNEGEVEAIETPRAAPPPHDLLARLILPCGQPSVEQIEQEPDPIGVDHVLLTVCGDLDDIRHELLHLPAIDAAGLPGKAPRSLRSPGAPSPGPASSFSSAGSGSDMGFFCSAATVALPAVSMPPGRTRSPFCSNIPSSLSLLALRDHALCAAPGFFSRSLMSASTGQMKRRRSVCLVCRVRRSAHQNSGRTP